MAEDTALLDPAERGTLSLHDAVVEHIAERAALDLTTVVRQTSTMENLTGRGLPRAKAAVAGRRARVSLEIAVTWPSPVADVAAQVRDHVSARIGALTGLDVDAVDVSTTMVHTSSESAR